MDGLQHTRVLNINDSAFGPLPAKAYVDTNGEILTVERETIPDDFGIAYGRMVKESEAKSSFQKFKDAVKYVWVQTKLVFRKIGVFVGIIPKVSQKTHSDVFHPEKAQRDIHNPLLKELKNNPPKLKSVTGSSLKDLERKRERVFQEQKKSLFVTPVREMRIDPPKLSSEFCPSIAYLEEKRNYEFHKYRQEEHAKGELFLLEHSVELMAKAAAKKAKNAEGVAVVKARKDELVLKKKAELESRKQLHEQKIEQNRELKIATYTRKTVNNVIRRELVKFRKAKLGLKAQDKLAENRQLHEQKMKQAQEKRDALIAMRIMKATKHNAHVEKTHKEQAELKAKAEKRDPLGLEALNAKRFMQLEEKLEVLHKELQKVKGNRAV